MLFYVQKWLSALFFGVPPKQWFLEETVLPGSFLPVHLFIESFAPPQWSEMQIPMHQTSRETCWCKPQDGGRADRSCYGNKDKKSGDKTPTPGLSLTVFAELSYH